MSVLLKDLSDYIEPSQACVKPIEKSISNEEKPVLINLNDCLACSGCITSSESILVSMQTSEELEKAVKNEMFIVASISPQSVASIAAKYKVDIQEASSKLCWFLETLGVHRILDISLSRSYALLESEIEFMERFESGKNLPMLCSSCPGWICYAEKMHDYLLDNISAVKSPQQIVGSFVSHLLREEEKLENIFHFSIMPCYDKKLEASRKDFVVEDKREVDCVLTTREIEQFWIEKGFAFDTLGYSSKTVIMRQAGSSAGGYLEFLIEKLRERKFPHCSITSIDKMKDLKEYRIVDSLGDVKSRFASVYGFKNIQNLVRKIKMKKCEYDYVEVMACPSACIAGGGQLSSSSTASKEFIKESIEKYNSIEIAGIVPDETFKLMSSRQLLRTQYHTVPKATFNVNTQW